MKIKVLFFVSTLENGGPTSVILNIIRYFDPEKFTAVILTLSPEPSKSQKKDFGNLGIPIYQLNESRLDWLTKGGHNLRKLIGEEIKPDIIHSHSVRPDVAAAKYLNGYKRMATIHANLFSAYKATYGRLVATWFTTWQLSAMQKLEQTVACSKWVHSLYKSKIRNLDMIQNGIDHERFYFRGQQSKNTLRNKFSLPVDKRIFISAGGLTTLKDPETIIKAFLKLNREDCVLVILGDGPVRPLVESYASAHSNIIYKGFTPEVADYYAASDYFISASHSEGLPNSVMEALASGLPAVLSDITPHREILEIDMRAGEMFKCRDDQELAEKLLGITEKDPEELRKYATEIITGKLNARSMSEKYQQIYVRLVGKSISN